MDSMRENYEEDNLTGINHEGETANTPVERLAATSIIGDKVENFNGEHLGEVRNLMINIEDGNIEYAILEFGGFLGMGEKLFAIPFRALSLDSERRIFILNKDRETFKDAPGFDKDHWPDTNGHYEQVNAYWGNFMGVNTGTVPY